jgi:drug/metabolite transporter (DMT)-like permease
MPTSSASPVGPRHERHGALLATVSASGFAAMVVFAKLAYGAGANVVTLLGARFALAAVVLWALAARVGAARACSRRDALAVLALGAFVYGGESLLAFTALARIDASLTELLLFTHPAIVVLGAAALRHEQLSRRRLGALTLSLAGLVLVLGGGLASSSDPLGIALALAAAALYAGYVLAAGRFDGRLHTLTFAALVCSGAALAQLTAGACTGTLRPGMSLAAWAWVPAIAIVSTVVAVTAFVGAVARLGPSRASIVATLEPAIACVLAFLLLGERLAPLQIVGATLLVGAAVAVQCRCAGVLRGRPHARSELRADPCNEVRNELSVMTGRLENMPAR